MARDIAGIFEPPTNIQKEPAAWRPIYILYPLEIALCLKYQLFSINNTAANPKYETSAARDGGAGARWEGEVDPVHCDVSMLSARRRAEPVGARGPAGSTEAPRVNADPHRCIFVAKCGNSSSSHLFGKPDGEEPFLPTIKDALYLKTHALKYHLI